MAFRSISQLDTADAVKFMICDYYAVDTERQLCLWTTSGRTRNARRWFVSKYLVPSGRRDWDAGKVMFRAWTFNEAMQRLSETRIAKRIDKLAAPPASGQEGE
jgi:hypothetical protein